MSNANSLPRGWVGATLEAITLPQATCNPRRDRTDVFLYVDIDALDNTRQTITAPKELPVGEAPSRARMLIHEGDVLFSLVRPYLRNIAIIPANLDRELASTAYYVLRPGRGMDSRFLFYQVLQDAFIASVPTYGNSPPSARDDEFVKLEIFVAPSKEQRRIADEIEKQFTRLDAGVAALRRVEANLRRYKAAVLKAAVEGRLTERWRAEHPDAEPASELLKRILTERRRRWEQSALTKMRAKGKPPTDDRWKKKYKEPIAPDADALPPLPTGWTWATVAQVSHLIQYGSSVKASEDAIGVPTLRMGNITTDGRIADADLKYVPAEHDEFPALLLADGDLLFNRTNSAELVGKSAVYRGRPDPCSFASYLIRVRTLPGVSSDFVAACLNSSYGHRWIRSVVVQQVGQANVNGTKLAAFAFPLPPRAEQAAIAEAMEAALTLAVHQEENVGNLRRRSNRLRQSILKRAFEGKLVPQDPTDEPASVLLDRIRSERAGAECHRTRPSRRVRRLARRKTTKPAKSGLTMG